mgnify:CR=1 FL=1
MQITKELLKEWSACRDGYGWFVSKFPQGAAYTEVSAALRADKRYADDTWLASNAFRFLFNAPELIENFVKADVDALIAAVQPSIDSTLAASGYGSRLAASGYDSRLAASCYDSRLAASGNYSTLAASGNGSTLAASGNDSRLAASGNDSRLAASGYGSGLAASGNGSTLAASGYGSTLAASGNYSTLAASGYGSTLAASGNDSTLAASGYDSRLEAKGNCSVAMAAGLGSIAAAGEKGAFAIAWKDSSEQMRIAVGIVGENGIKASVLYRVGETGELEEVAQ